jgi:hypothetical protein
MRLGFGGICIVGEEQDSDIVAQLWSQPFLGPTCFWAISCRPCGFPHIVCILPELEAVEEHDVKMKGTLVLVGWPYLCDRTHLHFNLGPGRRGRHRPLLAKRQSNGLPSRLQCQKLERLSPFLLDQMSETTSKVVAGFDYGSDFLLCSRS